MNREQASVLVKLLAAKGVHFAKGLSDEEVIAIQCDFKILFPADLRLFLQTALPISNKFVNWREGLNSKSKEDEIQKRLNWPLEGMLFDIDANGFWLDEWGERPESFAQQKVIVEQHYQHWPKLIPVYSHRYIPSTPYEEGNPILSVYQTDIIYYGYDLADYFSREFSFILPTIFQVPEQPKAIAFWDNFLA
ncbi:hypothetical protein SOASR032_21430 [Pragia fontium]|uniref:SMI1/KNR4 family protein n=1 Tax=Pragia fontium TaxID=82985 RepID=A0ABQ5LK17_9GAMM|nr:SMI1/KNR4 family protein [Pragia fontium]GKX63574.1 hypothetical protein SOASR032_21430 [Pragia fontium]